MSIALYIQNFSSPEATPVQCHEQWEELWQSVMVE